FHLSGGQSWDEIAEQTADQVVDTFCRYAPNVKQSILGRLVTTPLDWQRLTDNLNGCAWHVDMEIHQAWGLRPLPELSQYRTPLQGLYLTGSGVHPGGGITGMPGRNAALEVLRDRGHRVPKKGVVSMVKGYWKLWQSFQRFRKMTE
ncbi:MAG: hypothetical protein WCP21_18475, partial [Armatimonadota bacterium]